ncbi:MAG: UDP-N-acetylglucosamine--N-acetylmuramyl-(pentapeptide) pyrophosphoryl-undecaprenol N-acetylglucosamine transferase [bacterium]
MKIAVCCGGTGGHIFPGLAVAEELKSRGHVVVLWLAGRNVEGAAVTGWTGAVVTVQAHGFAGIGLRSVVAAYSLIRSFFFCRKRMKEMRPSVLLAMGSYASVGPVLAARSLGVRVVLHEANAVPGRAISMLARWADIVAVSDEGTRRFLKGRRCVYTGFPVRKEIACVVRKGNGSGLFTILVLGGSQGAHAVNEVVATAVCTAHKTGLKLKVIHLSGLRDETAMRARYEQAGVAHEVHGFLRQMEQAYSVADFAICRAGAATCSELAAVGLPSLLVPLPGAPRDHQTANARAMLARGAADMIEQGKLTVEWLVAYLQSTALDCKKLEKMKSAASAAHAGDATATLAGLVETTGKEAVCPQ